MSLRSRFTISSFMPLRRKWLSIVIACFLPVGVHYSQQIDSLKPYFSADEKWDPPITGTYWGFFQTCYMLPNLFIPLIAGALMDHVYSPALVCVFFLIITCLGQLTFAYATYNHYLEMAYIGRFLSGSGEGCISLMSGTIIAHAFCVEIPKRSSTKNSPSPQNAGVSSKNNAGLGPNHVGVSPSENTTNSGVTPTNGLLSLTDIISDIDEEDDDSEATDMASCRRCLVFALGISELFHAISNSAASGLAVPIIEYFNGNYSIPLFVAFFWCVFSLGIGVCMYVFQEKVSLDQNLAPKVVYSQNLSGVEVRKSALENASSKILPEAPPNQKIKIPETLSQTEASKGTSHMTNGTSNMNNGVSKMPHVTLTIVDNTTTSGEGTTNGTRNKPNGVGNCVHAVDGEETTKSLKRDLNTMNAPVPNKDAGDSCFGFHPALEQHISDLRIKQALERRGSEASETALRSINPAGLAILQHPTNLVVRPRKLAASFSYGTPGDTPVVKYAQPIEGGTPIFGSLDPAPGLGLLVSSPKTQSANARSPKSPKSPAQYTKISTTGTTIPSPLDQVERNGAIGDEVIANGIFNGIMTNQVITGNEDTEKSASNLLLVSSPQLVSADMLLRDDESVSLTCGAGGSALEWISSFHSGSRGFWCVLFFHLAFSASRRLFGHIDTDFFLTAYHVPLKQAGYLSGLINSGGVVLPLLMGLLFMQLQSGEENSERPRTPLNNPRSQSVLYDLGDDHCAKDGGGFYGKSSGMISRSTINSANSLDDVTGGAPNDNVNTGTNSGNPHGGSSSKIALVKRVSLGILTGCAFVMSACYTMFAITFKPVKLPVLLLTLICGIEPTIIKSLVPFTTVHLATAFGCFETVECLAKTVGGPIIGFLKDDIGDYSIDLYMFATLLMTATIFGVWTLRRDNNVFSCASSATASGIGTKPESISASKPDPAYRGIVDKDDSKRQLLLQDTL